MSVVRRQPAGVHCEILVRGPLKIAWLDQLSELSLTDTETPRGVVSLLRGEVTDQAALMGVLNGLDGLGLSLLSISCRAIEPKPAL